MTEHQVENSKPSPVLSTPIQRADELLRKMTLEEKVMQLSCVYPMGLLGIEGPIQSQLDTQLGQGMGHIAGLGTFGHKTPEKIAKTINALQRYLVTQTRLKIPAIFHNEALNGVVSPYFMHFPTPIGLAATWDLESVEDMAKIMRRQMRSVGMLQALSPVMDLARDARWGRVHETYGEDPYLVSAMSIAFTRGMQGDDLSEGVLATAKHFLGYAVTEAGQNMASTAVSARELRDLYARPFEGAIRLCGLGSVMASYSEFDGIPIHISHDILTKLLRGQLGFTGTVVSDYVGVGWAQTRQHAATTAQEVGSLALAAGMDVELPTIHGYGQVLAKAVRNGKVPESLLDESVRRVLRDKFALGLFDNPYVSENEAQILSIAKEGADLSKRLARESVTLLKNENGLLPLNHDIARIGVIGPHADSTLIGFPAYTYPAALQMLRSMFAGGETSMAGTDSSNAWLPAEARAAMKAEFQDLVDIKIEDYIKSNYQAVSLSEAIRKLLPKAQVTSVVGVGVTSSEPTDIPTAVAAAENADVVILYVGGQSAWSGKNRTEGEGQDSANIDLPSQQVDLIKAITAVGKPTVAVVAMGRPQGLSSVIDHLPAVLTAYYGGPFQGIAIADALFGFTNPGGKLPYTLPRHVGQVPIYHSQRVGSGYRRTTYDVHKGYVDMPSTPLFVFGHGLSYTTFEYSPLEVENSAVDTGGEIQFSITITNTGKLLGSEVVQIYISDTATGVTLPAQQLVGFSRVTLEPNSSRKIKFRIPVTLLGYTGLSGEFVIEPGPVEVSAGSSSNDIRSSAKFTITGEPHTITGADRTFVSVTEMDL
jgi:beta-glucosidase